MSFLNICPEHEIGVHNNQTWPDLGFLSWLKFDRFNLRERWLSNQGSGVNTHRWWPEQFLKRPANKADLFRFIGQEMVND